MNIKQKSLQLFFIFFLGLFFAAVPQQSYAAGDTGVIKAERTIIEIFEYLKEAHLSQPQPEQLVNGAIRGMIETLADPYTVYLSDLELEQLTRNLGDYYAGIGVYLEEQPDYPVILEVYPDSPAARSGLKAGDIIIKIDGLDIKGFRLSDAISLITGQPGSELKLEIRRGSKKYAFNLYRELLTVPNISSKKIGSRTGYISIQSFGKNTSGHFRNHLKQLQSQNITGLVIDLRGNIGGYIDSAVEIAEFFLEQNKLIVVTKNFDDTEQRYVSQEKSPLKIPTVILINNQTASAAELLSASLSDNGAAVLVGENTYGKGTAQSIIPLESGGALKMTTAEYVTPKGIHLEGQGLSPDYYVATPGLQAFFALRLLEPGIYPIKFNINKEEAVIDNEAINTGSTPLYKNGTYYLPLRFTLEAFGYTVQWDGNSGEITANRDKSKLVINNRGIWLNGKPLNITNGVIFENGRSYMPVGLLLDLGCQVDFNREFITVKK